MRHLRWILPLLAISWIAAGVRTLDPRGELTVVELRGIGTSWRAAGELTVAPPGLCRLSRYPLGDAELPLPDAGRAALQAADGTRFGFQGWLTIRLRPDEWPRLHAAAAGSGLSGVALESIREAARTLDVDRRRRTLDAVQRGELERSLREALAMRGAGLVELDLDRLDLRGSASADAVLDPSTRLLLVGLDGADWAIIDPLIERGRLPNLARLIAGGVRGKLRTISPMLSPVIWTSVATGVEPIEHGVLDFLVAGEDGTGQPVTSAQRRVPAVWEMLSEAGVEVGVVGWWASWPADPVRGYLVSDRLAYQLFGYQSDPDDARGKTWPPDLYDGLRRWVTDPRDVTEQRVSSLLGALPATEAARVDRRHAELLDQLRTLLASGDTYVDVARGLASERAPEFEAVYLEGTDTIGHLFMRFRPPQLPGVDGAELARFGPIVDRYYELADAQLGTLLEGRDESWTVVVISDHGFASDATRPRTSDPRIGHGAAAEWHRRFGIVVLSGRHVRAAARLDEASVYDIAPTVLALFGRAVPSHWPGRVLLEALDPEFVARHPPRTVEQDADSRRRARATPDDPDAADLMAKLESLGYVSSGGARQTALTAMNNTAVSLMGQGRHAEAEQGFRNALADHPGSTMLQLNLGLCLSLQGRGAEAAELFEVVLRRSSGPGRRTAAVQLARFRRDAGKLDEAERLLRAVLADEPDAVDALTTLGTLQEQRGETDAAQTLWRRAAAIDLDAAAPRNHLGTLARSVGDLDQAERWFRAAIEADPYFMGSYNNLALVYQARDRLDLAIDLYRRALLKSPEHPTVLNNLGSLQFAAGDHAEAGRLWRQATRVDPLYVSPLNNLAGLAIAGQRWDDALALLTRALEIDATYGDAQLNLATVFEARGEPERARRALEAAAGDPRAAAGALLALGSLEMRSDRPQQAARLFESALRSDPHAIDLLNSLGEALRRSGRPEQALARWRESIRLDPDQPAIRLRMQRLEQDQRR